MMPTLIVYVMKYPHPYEVVVLCLVKRPAITPFVMRMSLINMLGGIVNGGGFVQPADSLHLSPIAYFNDRKGYENGY
jgi:hypothetical protein